MEPQAQHSKSVGQTTKILSTAGNIEIEQPCQAIFGPSKKEGGGTKLNGNKCLGLCLITQPPKNVIYAARRDTIYFLNLMNAQ